MTSKQIIKKIIFIVLTLTACSGLVVLLVAAIGKRNHELCRDCVIAVKGTQKDLFIDENDVRKLLTAGNVGKIKGQPIAGFNLRKLEQLLKENAWVKNANLYFDNRDILHVSVFEREPIARVFTTTGKSFYIDSNCVRMPLSAKISAKLPVFTNFPDKRILTTRDSLLLSDIKKTAGFILSDPFWMAQTEQIDIVGDRNFELVPTVGNHIVKLGSGDDIAKKFHRLFVFYQQVMSKSSFDRYKTVDVQYVGQVIGTRDKISRIDSLQLKKNIEKLLDEAKRMQRDTTISMPLPPQQMLAGPAASGKDFDETIPAKSQDKIKSNPVKPGANTKPKPIDKNAVHREPKAIMPAENK